MMSLEDPQARDDLQPWRSAYYRRHSSNFRTRPLSVSVSKEIATFSPVRLLALFAAVHGPELSIESRGSSRQRANVHRLLRSLSLHQRLHCSSQFTRRPQLRQWASRLKASVPVAKSSTMATIPIRWPSRISGAKLVALPRENHSFLSSPTKTDNAIVRSRSVRVHGRLPELGRCRTRSKIWSLTRGSGSPTVHRSVPGE
jgi:hypothetical protein